MNQKLINYLTMGVQETFFLSKNGNIVYCVKAFGEYPPFEEVILELESIDMIWNVYKGICGAGN